MSRHDYSQSTVTSVSDAIISCKNTVENTVLSVESMPYSWDTGIINNVVIWFEVLQIIDSKEQIRSMFEKADSKFGGTVQDIGRADSSAVRRLESELNRLRAFKEKMNLIKNNSLKTVQNISKSNSINTQNLDQTINSSKKNSKEVSDALGKWYRINVSNGESIKVNIGQIILSNIYSIAFISDKNFFKTIYKSIEDGKIKVNNGRIELGMIGYCHVYVETENAVDIDNEIHDLEEALTTFSIDEVIAKGIYSVEKDGTLKYSYNKKINNGTSLDISVSFNPKTGLSKVTCKIKYADIESKTNHSISLNFEKTSNVNLEPVSQYDFSNASDIYANMNFWQKAMKWAGDIMSELKYNVDKTTDQLSDMIISSMEKTYNFTRDKIINFPDLLRELNQAIDARDITMICFAIMAILAAAAEIGGCLVIV